MKTKITKNGDTIIVSVQGKLDYETQEPLKADLRDLIRSTSQSKNPTDSVPTKIIFNFEKLEFVGSSGISAFVQTLRDFNSRSGIRPVYCNVRSEFKKIIKAFDEDNGFDFYDGYDQ